MSRISLFLQARRRLVTAGTLFAGFAAALVIYVTATPPPDNPLGYRPEDSKKYLREMELYGGKVNVLASDFRQWFEGLWHGRRLALTVAVLSVLFAFVGFIASTPLPRDGEPDEPEEHLS